MNRFLLYFLLIQSCTACSMQNKKIMETFKIAEFNKNALGGVYHKTLDDGTEIKQFGDSSMGYVENAFPPKGWFYLQKEFYPSGILKAKGERFKKGDYQAGIWLSYDSAGYQTGEINYDAPFKQTLQSVFKILDQKKIPFSASDIYNSITRGQRDTSAPYIWIVQWKALPDRLERIEIDDASGKITNTDFTPFNENH